MNKSGNFIIFGLVLICLCVLSTKAEPEPEPEPAKGLLRSAYFNEPANPKFRSVPLPDDADDHIIAEIRQTDDAVVDSEDGSNPSNADTSKGRLFMNKFLLFKNMFGNNQQQPVIPIIITGAGNTGTGTTTAPTATITSTGTIPSATGTITTTPITQRMHVDGENEEGGAEEAAEGVNVQALQAALAAGAQEYVVTDQEIKGTTDSKATKQENINLRRKGAKRGQVIQLRIPPQYRRYFKNGQKVVLNSGNRQSNRRVIKKRVTKNRRRVNKNKNNRNRFVPIV